jgi:hypothetical protein
MVYFPQLPAKGDVTDWIEAGHGPEDLRKRVATAPPWRPRVDASPMLLSPPKQQLLIRRASDIVPEKLIWIWRDRIAEGKLVLLGWASWPGQEPPGNPSQPNLLAQSNRRDGVAVREQCSHGKAPGCELVVVAGKPERSVVSPLCLLWVRS